MIEGDVFKIIVEVPKFDTAEGGGPPPEEGALETKAQTGPESRLELGLESSKVHEAHDEAHEAHDEAHVPLTRTHQRILVACREGERSAPELQSALGYESRTGNFKRSLTFLLEAGLLEWTLPDSPRSKNQRYRVTPKGRKLLDKHEDN